MNDIINMFSRHCDKMQSLSGGQFISLCPFHNDSKRSFSFNVDGLYNCKACGESGNAVKFAKLKGENPKPFYSDNYKRNNTSITSNRLITDKNGESMYDKTDINRHKKKFTTEQLWEKITNEYHTEWYGSLWKNLNCVGNSKGHLTFPYFDKAGKNPIAIKHHKSYPFWEGDGKLKFYMEWQIPFMDKTKPLIIVEGEEDTLTMLDGKYNAVSGSAGTLSIPPIPDSFKDFPEIIILYDNDEAGVKGAKKMADVIYESLGVLPSIGKWRDGLPNKFDCSDDKENTDE